MSYELYFKLNYWFDVMCIVSVKGKVNSLFIPWGNHFLNVSKSKISFDNYSIYFKSSLHKRFGLKAVIFMNTVVKDICVTARYF